MRLTDLGPPAKSSESWDAWYCPCGTRNYPTLLLNKKTGYLFCGSCKHREWLKDVGTPGYRRPFASDRTEVEWLPIEPGSVHERFLHQRTKNRPVGDWAVHPRHLNYVAALVVERGEVVYWHARVIPILYFGASLSSPSGAHRDARPGSSARKWLSPGAGKDEHVYNLDGVKRGYPVFVCEGIFDALWFWPQGVAVMGPRSSEGQRLKILEREPSKVVICPDSDVSRHSLADEVLGWHKETRVIEVSTMRPKTGFKDWGEMLEIAGPKGLRLTGHGGVGARNRA